MHADGHRLIHGLRRGSNPLAYERGGFKLDPEPAATTRPVRIRCPHCQWQPRRDSLWFCLPTGHPEYLEEGCGHAWNTFDTRGRCPGCGYQWRNTSCLSCSRWSRHEDWYEIGSGDLPEA